MNKEKNFFIRYVDDDEQVRDAWVENVLIKDGCATFPTSSNLITIPIHRVIKIKQKMGGGEDESS